MKKLLILMTTLTCVLCFSSCEKEKENSTNALETSYWVAEFSAGYYYVGIEDNLDDMPIEANTKYTHRFSAEIQEDDTFYVFGGIAYRDKNQIHVNEIVSTGGEWLDVYEYNGEVLSCEYEGEHITFSKISKEEFYDSVQGLEEL